jgi:urease accessory protein
MLDATQPTLPPKIAPVMQRVRGRGRVVFGPAGLRDLHQSGSAKAMMPKIHTGIPEVVFLNTSGGLTGGDRLDYHLQALDHTALIGTSQTAERAYASTDISVPAQVTVDLIAGQGASLEWLPQETILFEKSRLARKTQATLATDARFLFVESLVLGRAAMGETIHTLHLRDTRQITRAGRLEFLEPLEMDADVLAGRDSVVTLAGMAEVLKPLTQNGVTAGVSGWNGKLIIRAMAHDGYPLRRYVAQILTKIRGTTLPRVWQV